MAVLVVQEALPQRGLARLGVGPAAPAGLRPLLVPVEHPVLEEAATHLLVSAGLTLVGHPGAL